MRLASSPYADIYDIPSALPTRPETRVVPVVG